MRIIKTTTYNKSFNKNLVKKHLIKEIDRIDKIEELITNSDNMQELIINPLHIIYGIEKKQGELKEIYTAKVNEKLRLWMKPVGEYPYNLIEITDIEFLQIDNKHYGEG